MAYFFFMSDKKFSCAILAGGQSRRFGRDKTVAKIDGVTFTEIIVKKLLDLSDDIMIISKNSDKFNFNYKNVKFLEDETDKQSPLVGIATALNNSVYENVFTIAADTPFVSNDLVMFLWSQTDKYDVTVTKTEKKINTLFGFYHKRVLPLMVENIVRENYKLIDIYPILKVNIIDNTDTLKKYDAGLLSFFNINSQEDYTAALKMSNKAAFK